jgi:hypothetical protein
MVCIAWILIQLTFFSANQSKKLADYTVIHTRTQDWIIPVKMATSTAIILSDLMDGESWGDEYALNPKDKDRTPSYGCLQYKPSTLLMSVKDFNLLPDIEDAEIMNVMFDCQLQVRAFLSTYGDGKPISWWQSQFPQVSLNNGYWKHINNLSTE